MPPEANSNIYLFIARHGKAEETSFSVGPTLNNRGKVEAKLLGENLKKDNFPIKHIYHSGVTRSTQTAEVIQNELISAKLSLNPKLAESFDKNTGYWLTLIESLSESTLLVGHLPTIQFILNLTNPNINFEFSTGSCIGLLKNNLKLTYSEAWSYKIPS